MFKLVLEGPARTAPCPADWGCHASRSPACSAGSSRAGRQSAGLRVVAQRAEAQVVEAVLVALQADVVEHVRLAGAAGHRPAVSPVGGVGDFLDARLEDGVEVVGRLRLGCTCDCRRPSWFSRITGVSGCAGTSEEVKAGGLGNRAVPRWKGGSANSVHRLGVGRRRFQPNSPLISAVPCSVAVYFGVDPQGREVRHPPDTGLHLDSRYSVRRLDCGLQRPRDRT